MWIRSQDGMIICKATNIQIVRKCVNEVGGVLNWFIYNDSYMLGIYDSEDSAIEILNQIAFRLTCESYDHAVFTLP